MEKNLSAYINRLIELDSKAVELKERRDSELFSQESGSRNELKSIEKILDEAALEAKQERNRIVEEARQQAVEIGKTAELKISVLQTYFASISEDAAGDIWKQLLAIER